MLILIACLQGLDRGVWKVSWAPPAGFRSRTRRSVAIVLESQLDLSCVLLCVLSITDAHLICSLVPHFNLYFSKLLKLFCSECVLHTIFGTAHLSWNGFKLLIRILLCSQSMRFYNFMQIFTSKLVNGTNINDRRERYSSKLLQRRLTCKYTSTKSNVTTSNCAVEFWFHLHYSEYAHVAYICIILLSGTVRRIIHRPTSRDNCCANAW